MQFVVDLHNSVYHVKIKLHTTTRTFKNAAISHLAHGYGTPVFRRLLLAHYPCRSIVQVTTRPSATRQITCAKHLRLVVNRIRHDHGPQPVAKALSVGDRTQAADYRLEIDNKTRS